MYSLPGFRTASDGQPGQEAWMTAVRDDAPTGRYGRRPDDARTERRLKLVGGALGVGMLALVAWLGYSYITGQEVSGELIKFRVISDEEVQAQLEVRKDADATGVCTVRSQAADGSEVGRADFTFGEPASRVDKVVTLRTIARAATAELVGCQPADRD